MDDMCAQAYWQMNKSMLGQGLAQFYGNGLCTSAVMALARKRVLPSYLTCSATSGKLAINT